MSSYTPGPWGCGKTPAGWYEVFPKQHNLICLATRIDHEADAYIIATAPEMVEWMKSVIRAFCEDEIGALDELDSKKVDELFAKGADILHRALTGEEDQHGRQLENRW